MSRPEVVVYGTVALDRFLRVNAQGQPLSEAIWEEKPGGEALNTALALIGWGVSVALIGTATGTDAEGRRLRELMEAEGISQQGIPQAPDAVTPCCEIRVFPDGERTMSGRGFAQAIAPPLPEGLFHHQPLVAIDPNLGKSARAVALTAASRRCRVVAMDFAHDPDVVCVAQVLQISEESLRRWGGAQGSPEEVVTALHGQGAQFAVLTQGAKGGVVASVRGIQHFTACAIPDALDTTGAGDAFRAGLCYGLVQRWEQDDTLRFARAAAACHCRRRGGGSKVPLEEIFSLQNKSPNFVRSGAVQPLYRE